MHAMTEARPSEVRLGPRERQVAELLLQACSNREIAQALGMAERTVKAHLHKMFLKFGIRGGIKRVRLAVLLYRIQQREMETGNRKLETE
jgi:ATP/maltotriose-dependent transcriptional regulator MalT